MEEEVWKAIPNQPNYLVSNFGRVKSLKRKIWNGSCYFFKKERILIGSTDKDGYKCVTINRHSYKVHRLVAKLFVFNPHPNKWELVNHIDENKSNNYYKNLEWCNHSYNNTYNGNMLKKLHTKYLNKSECAPKKVGQYIGDKCIAVYNSLMDVERELGFRHQNISTAARRGKLAYNYKWRYLDE